MAGRVPPSPLEPLGTVLAPRVIVAVHRTELGPLLGQTLSELPVNFVVDNSEPAKVDTESHVIAMKSCSLLEHKCFVFEQ